MVDNLRLPHSNMVIVDENNAIVSGAKLEIFDAGTTDQKDVFSDAALTVAADNPIVANGNGVIPVRYIGTGDYKVTYKNASDVTLTNYTTEDDVPGADDTSSFLTGTVSPSRSIISKTANYTTVAGDVGKQINADATGGSFTITLLSAVTAGDGGDFVVKHSGTANAVTVSATQNIDQKNSHILQSGDSGTYRSDGSNYHIAEAYSFTSGIVVITYAAAITPNFSFPDDTDFQVTLTGALTINAPTNLRVGQKGTFTLIQDATGGRVTTFNAVFKGTPNIDTTASAVNKINFHVRTATDIDLWPTEPPAQVPTRTLIETQNPTSGTTVLFDNIADTFFMLQFEAEGLDTTAASWNLEIEVSDDNGSTFNTLDGFASGFSNVDAATDNATPGEIAILNGIGTENLSFEAFIDMYTSTNQIKFIRGVATMKDTSATVADHNYFNFVTTDSSGAIDAVRFSITTANTFTAGEIRLYGWN